MRHVMCRGDYILDCVLLSAVGVRLGTGWMRGASGSRRHRAREGGRGKRAGTGG